MTCVILQRKSSEWAMVILPRMGTLIHCHTLAIIEISRISVTIALFSWVIYHPKSKTTGHQVHSSWRFYQPILQCEAPQL